MAKGLPRSLRNAQFGAPGEVLKQTIPVRNGQLTVAAAGVGVGFGTLVIGDFPDGNILLLGAVGYFQFNTADADIGATWTSNFAVGSAPTVAGALTTNEADIAVGATAAATAKLSPYSRAVSATPGASYPQILDNQAGALEMNLNLAVTAADIVDASSAVFTVNGVLHIAYLILGDA